MDNRTPDNPPSVDLPSDTAPTPPDDQQIETAQAPGKFKFTWQFAAGFIGWYLVIGLIFWIGSDQLIGLSCVIQVIALISTFAIKEWRNIGWGMLSAIGVNLLVSLALNLVFNALCFIPFFKPVE